MVRALAAAGVLVCAFTASAGPVEDLVTANTRPMTLDGGALGGPGAEFLIEEATSASFLVIGESHLNTETPGMVRAMLPALAEAGYTALAIETGERIAGHAEREIESGNVDRFARLMAEVPFTAAFIDHAPELALLESAAGEHGMELWGLDQVFLGGARFNLSELVRLAPDDGARELAQRMLDRANAGFMNFARSGDPSSGFLNSATSEDFAALRVAFAERTHAIAIINELETSGEIYRLFRSGANYESNKTRIDLMKRHLAERVREHPIDEKVVMKFGAIHAGRGYTPLNMLDVGNAAAELGVLKGGGSLHVTITSAEYADRAPELETLAAAMGEEAAWVVIDLRALRPYFHREPNRAGHEALNGLVWRYDLVVLGREFTPAERLPGVPAPPGR